MGVYIDRNARMTAHVKIMYESTYKQFIMLLRILPNIGGPKARKRKMLAVATLSRILYAANIWYPATKYRKYNNMLSNVNRKLSLRIIAGYRTVNTQVAEVLARLPPMDLQIEERSNNHKVNKEEKKERRVELYRKWQERWDKYTGNAKIYIKNILRDGANASG